MRLPALLLLPALLCVVPAPALDRSPRKQRTAPQAERAATDEPAPAPSPEPTLPDGEAPTLRSAPCLDLAAAPCLDLSAGQADTLVAAWHERRRRAAFDEFFHRFVLADTTALDASAFDATPDSVYRRRLFELASPVRLPYNEIVKGYIRRYTDPRYGTIARILGLSKHYFPMIEDELLKEELPVELRVLPIIESGLSPVATSHAGAVGLWQFIPSTGKNYGLEVNSLVDERRDPVRSTQAACRYLKDLYAIYGDWTLVLAAYNCGPGNVNKAIARSGGKTFWEIYDFLPGETRGYVPAFIGAAYAYAYHPLHGIEPVETSAPLSVDTVRIDRLMHFGQIASTIDVPLETLRELNPQYKLDIVPATTKSYTLVLPQRNVAQYILHESDIRAKDSMYLKEYIDPANIDRKRTEQPAASYYTVKNGDTLGAIARRFRVTTSQLMSWNGIKDPRKLRAGQRIRVSRR